MEIELVKVLQLKYPSISYTNKLYEGNKKNIVNSNFTLQNAKIALQNKKIPATNFASLEKLLQSYFVMIIQMLCCYYCNILSSHSAWQQKNVSFNNFIAKLS